MRRVVAAIYFAVVLSFAVQLAGCGDDADSQPSPSTADPATSSVDGTPVEAATAAVDAGAPAPDVAAPTLGTCEKVAQYCADSPYALFLEPLSEDNCNAVFQCLLDTYAPPCVARWQAVMDCIEASVASADDCNKRCWSEMLDFMGNCECLTRCGVTNCSGAGLDGGVPTDTGCGMQQCPDTP